MTNALHEKYRPNSFDTIYGQEAAVRQLQQVVERRASHAFLFSGPSGVGKTTLARIVAKELNCDDITEIQAARFTGIDDMRAVQDNAQYKSIFGENPNRAVILDECHSLSRQAWDSLLKIVEEPPEHLFWFLCTTLPDKVPPTIRTRCLPIKLIDLSKDDLTDLANAVAEAEGIKLDADIRQLLVREAHGSARQLLVNLTLCRDVRDRKTAADALNTALESDAGLALCRLLATGQGGWPDAMQIVEKLNGQNAEGVRIQVLNYLATAARNAKTDRQAAFFLQRMEHFAHSYGYADADAQLLRSIGLALFAE